MERGSSHGLMAADMKDSMLMTRSTEWEFLPLRTVGFMRVSGKMENSTDEADTKRRTS